VIVSTGEEPKDLCANSLRESAVRPATMSFDVATAGPLGGCGAAPLRVLDGWLGAGVEYGEEVSAAGTRPDSDWPSGNCRRGPGRPGLHHGPMPHFVAVAKRDSAGAGTGVGIDVSTGMSYRAGMNYPTGVADSCRRRVLSGPLDFAIRLDLNLEVRLAGIEPAASCSAAMWVLTL
jgi:hypothetical protein